MIAIMWLNMKYEIKTSDTFFLYDFGNERILYKLCIP